MGLTKHGKLQIIAAQLGPLENELYTAATEQATREAGVEAEADNVTQEMVEEIKSRKAGLQAQVDVLDSQREEVEAEADDEA